jgi:hypothetical protein
MQPIVPLLAGQRRPGLGFRLPPKLAAAADFCRDSGKQGADYSTLNRRFGPHAVPTLLLLGFLERGADEHYRVTSAGDPWIDAHHQFRKGPELPGNRQAEDLSAEREKQALKLCQRPRTYESITRVCGDVSTLHLIEEQLLQWVSTAGAKRRPWQSGPAQLHLTEKGLEFLTSQRR